MRFLLAGLHRAAYRQQIAAADVPLNAAPDIVQLDCPRCGAVYVADLAIDDEPWDLEACEGAALVRLDRGCPGHTRRFVVGL